MTDAGPQDKCGKLLGRISGATTLPAHGRLAATSFVDVFATAFATPTDLGLLGPIVLAIGGIALPSPRVCADAP